MPYEKVTVRMSRRDSDSSSSSESTEIEKQEPSENAEERYDQPLPGAVGDDPGMSTVKERKLREEESESTSAKEMKDNSNPAKLVGDEKAGTVCCLLL